MTSVWRLIAIIIAAAVAGAAVTFAIVHKNDESKEEAPAKTERHATVENGEPTIEIDEATQKMIGLQTAPAVSAQQTEDVQTLGTVVDVQELAALQNQVASARAQLQQVDAKSAFDRAELERLRALNADNRAVSDRAVQEAAAAVAVDQANAAGANAALQAAEASAVQRFGRAIGSAMLSGSQLYRDLVTFRSVLVQLSLPGGIAPPDRVILTSNSGSSVGAHLLSPAPRVDPRLQGSSVFYVAPGGTLSPGMNVSARIGTSQHTANGVAVPGDALVSWQGRSWVYFKRDATHFTRREVAGGFTTNIPAGTPLVTTGAQQLLSDEMRSQLGEE